MREKITSSKTEVTFLKRLIKYRNKLIEKHSTSTKSNNDNNNKRSINIDFVETKSSNKNCKNDSNENSIMITR